MCVDGLYSRQNSFKTEMRDFMRKEKLFREIKCKGKKIFAMSVAAAVFMSALTTG